MTDTFDELNLVREELQATKEALRRAENEVASRLATHKEQLRAAKEKAKGLFLSKVSTFENEIRLLKETSHAREVENEHLKLMLRDADVEQSAKRTQLEAELLEVQKEKECAQAELAASTLVISQLTTQLTDAKAETAEARSETLRLSDEVTALKEEMEKVATAKQENPVWKSGNVNNTETDDSTMQTTEAAHDKLQPTSDQTTEVATVTRISSSERLLQVQLEKTETELQLARDNVHNLTLQITLLKSGNPAGDSLECDKPSTVSESSPYPTIDTVSVEKALKDALEEVRTLQERETQYLEKLSDYESRLEVAENSKVIHSQEESDANETKQAPHTDSELAEKVIAGRDELTKASEPDKLLARVAELEHQLSSKQSEINKVREKARAYLKDLNAEKREIEAKMKEDINRVQSSLKEAQEKLASSEQYNGNLVREVDTCMGIISEKQKTMNSMNLTIANERNAVRDAERQLAELQGEFSLYKERAHVALEERNESLRQARCGIEEATEKLRARVSSLEAELQKWRDMHAAAAAEAEEVEKYKSRAQKSEAALDLLMQDASVSRNVSVKRMDSLEGDLDCVRKDLEASQAALTDLKSRYSTTLVKLEIAERGLKAAEMRHEEAVRISEKTISELTSKIDTLQSALTGAQETAAAAQRTAAVAARAMSAKYTDDTLMPPSDDQSPRSAHFTGNTSIAEPPSPILFSPRSDAQESMSMPQRNHIQDILNDGQTNELELKDQRIAVLLSQIAELGTMLKYSQEESELRDQQTALLKSEVRDIQSKLAAAEKLQNEAPFSYMRTIVVKYLETLDPAILPVVCDVLSMSEEESRRIRLARGMNAKGGGQNSSYFGSLPFLRGS